MLRFITLDQMKTQCRIDEDMPDDDDYLNQIGGAAENLVESDLNRTLYTSEDDIPDTDITGMVVTPRHQQAMLIMVAQLYENREATIAGTSISEVPLSYQYLIERDRIIPV